MRRPQRGVVVSFDEERGLGSVRDELGRELPFHCTAIADGTRRIDPGTEVSFLSAPGHLGRMEARGLVALVVGPGPAAPAVPAEQGATADTVERDDDTLTVFMGTAAEPDGDQGGGAGTPAG